MSAIDHKEESERIMSDLGENFIAMEGQTDATMIATVIDALRHATLYAAEQTAELVKQQKLTNRIAWSTRVGYHPNNVLRAQIDEGVGLS